MKRPTVELSVSEFELLNQCIAWHVRPHREVVLKGLAGILPSLRFDDLNVLELGATARSTLSPFLVARGASATVTCYSESEIEPLKETLSHLSRQYGITMQRFHVIPADIFALDLKPEFDVVLLKDVLGGVNRFHDQIAFRKAVKNCLSMLNSTGQLLIIDKARSLIMIHWLLRALGAAGKNGWHYFTVDEMKRLIPDEFCEKSFAAHGILSFGDFGGGAMQSIADFLDAHVVEKLVPLEKRVVFQMTFAAQTKADAIV